MPGRRAQVRPILLFVLMPVIMLMGLVTINSISKANLKAFATSQGADPNRAETQHLCVIEDLQKYALVIMGCVGGTVICVLVRLEYDADFAKRSISRLFSYATVALVFSVQATPYLLMNISKDQPKPLCLFMGGIIAILSWSILEIIYSRAKAIAGWLVNKMPFPRVPDEKDKKPPTP